MANRATRWAQRVHRWLGILSGAFVFVIAVTGAILVFRTEIDRLLTVGVPVEVQETALPIDSLVARWREREPGATLDIIGLPIDGYGRRDWSAPYELWGVTGKGEERRWLLNPFTAEIIAPPSFDLGQFVRDIHIRLLVVDGPPWLRLTALVFVGVVGVALAMSIVSGVILHRRRLVRELFCLRRHGSRRVLLSDLHKRIAVWALLFHLLMAVTGAFLGLEVLWWAFQPSGDVPASSSRPASPVAVSLDDLADAAERAIPDSEPLQLILPQHEGEPVVVVMRNANPLIHHWSSKVSLDPSKATVLDIYDASEAGFWERLYFMIEPLHFGYYGGLPVKIAYCVLALGLAILPLSGLALWWGRRKAKVRRRAGSRRAAHGTITASKGIAGE